MTYQSKIFVFVSPNEVQFMKQFFTPVFHDWGYVEGGTMKTKPIKFYVSGGDCNPITQSPKEHEKWKNYSIV